MITITAQAADQIRKSTAQSQAQNLRLRVAARLEDDGKFEYGLGFDERRENDVAVTTEGIEVLIAPACQDLLVGAVLDYVELNPGEYRFIFINPNDPAHAATPKAS